MVTMASPSKALKHNPETATEFSALHRESHLFEDVAALQLDSLPLTGRGAPESVTVARVTPNYFALLGAPALVAPFLRHGIDELAVVRQIETQSESC